MQIQTEVSSASLSEHAWPAPGLSWVLRQEAAEGGLVGQRGGAPTLSGRRRSDVVGALQQGGDGVLQGHGHLLGGLAQQRAVGVVLLEVEDVALLALGRAAALLAHVQLGPPLLVRVLLLHTVDLLEVGLQRAALREGLVTQAALVGPHACREGSAGIRDPALGHRSPNSPAARGRGEGCPPRTPRPPAIATRLLGLAAGRAPLTCVGAHMPLEVEGVVEALPAVGAEMPLDVIVALHVAVQHALVGEGLLADVAGEEVSAGTVPQRHLWARAVCVTDTQELGLQVADREDALCQPPAPRRGATHPGATPLGHWLPEMGWWGRKPPWVLGQPPVARSASCRAPESLCKALLCCL